MGRRQSERMCVCGNSALFFSTLTLLASVCHHLPTLPTIANILVAFFLIADTHSNISHGPRKATLHLCMLQVSARGDTLSFLPQILPVNINYFNDIFHSNKSLKKENRQIFFILCWCSLLNHIWKLIKSSLWLYSEHYSSYFIVPSLFHCLFARKRFKNIG